MDTSDIRAQTAEQGIPEQSVVVHQRSVQYAAHRRDVKHQWLSALVHAALDNIDELEIPHRMNFVEDSAVRIQPVQLAAVRRAVLNHAVRAWVADNVAPHLEMLAQRRA